jgi:hypothetical protein
MTSTGPGYSYTLMSCPYSVVPRNPTSGQPGQRIQRGMGRPLPGRPANSVRAPSGHITPHQKRPTSSIEAMTNGHQMPQKANCAKRVRLLNMRASSGGIGRKGRYGNQHEIQAHNGPLQQRNTAPVARHHVAQPRQAGALRT